MFNLSRELPIRFAGVSIYERYGKINERTDNGKILRKGPIGN
jgi:hypothetical protein